MANVLVDEMFLTDIANAIREKNGTKETYKPVDMAMAIRSLSAGDSVDAMISRTLPLDYTNETVTRVGDSAFRNYKSLNSVSMPNITEIGGNAFKGSGITSATFDNVTKIGNYAFEDCSTLETISLMNLEDTNNYEFHNCVNLKNINIPKIMGVGYGTFSGCNSITSFVSSTVNSLGSFCFENCTSLEKVDLSNAVKIYQQCFKGCKKLTALILRSNTVSTIASGYQSGLFYGVTPAYIYVPAALVEEYKASNWSYYKDYIRAIEDYPEITA